MSSRVVVYIPHPDDETLSMWPVMHYLGAGYDLHAVFLTRGETTAAALRLDGAVTCTWGDHAYSHDPAREGYTLPTVTEIGLHRLAEGTSAVGAMSKIPGGTGSVFVYDENLGTAYGCSGCGSSNAPPTEDGIDAAEAVIRKYIDLVPNAFHFTMSPTDNHPDHAAAGLALRRLKGNPIYHGSGVFTYEGGDPVLAPLLPGARFFASKLYWGTATTPRDPDLADEYCSWFPNFYPNNNVVLTRRDEYTAWLRTKVIKAYTAWNPAEGSFAIGGGHSTAAQFVNCFGPQLSVVSALWHP